MPTNFSEQLPHSDGMIVSEANGELSREQVTFRQRASSTYKAGTVVGKRDDGKYEQLEVGSSEGNNTAVGVLLAEVDATAGDKKGVIIERLAEVRDRDLIWPAGISSANKAIAITALLTRNIKVRTTPTVISTQST